MAASELPEMPNGPIMELHGQRKRFHVPHGLKPLLEDMTREILRYQPDDIYDFLAKYVDAKAAKRKTEEKKMERKSWQHEERKYSTDGPAVLSDEELQEFLEELHIPKEVADKYATKIQAAFRGHTARKSLSSRGQTLHKDHKKSWEWKRWSWEGSSALSEDQLEEFLEEYHVSLPIANQLATKIQAAYRGHAARKSLGSGTLESHIRKSMKEPGQTEHSSEEHSSSPEEGLTEHKDKFWPKKAKIKKSLRPAKSASKSKRGSTAEEPEITEEEGDPEEAQEISPEELTATEPEPDEETGPEDVQSTEEEPESDAGVTDLEDEDDGAAL